MPHRRRSIAEVLQSFGIVLSPEQRVAVQEILRTMEETKEIFIITYPTGGGSQTFPVGTSDIDFLAGKVLFANNETDDLANNLETLDEPWMRSFFIETDQTIQISFGDGRNFYQVVQGDFLGLTYQQFQHVYIKTIQDTNISVWATTSPDAVLNKLKADSIRTSAVYRKLTGGLNLATAQSLTTSFTANFEIAAVFIHFDSGVTLTVTLTRVSALGTDYDTAMRSIDVVAGQNVYVDFAKGEGRIKSGDYFRVTIGASAGRTAYVEVLTEDV